MNWPVGMAVTIDALGKVHPYTCAAVRGHGTITAPNTISLGTYGQAMSLAAASDYLKKVVRK